MRSHEAREALAKVMVPDSRVREYYLDPNAVFDRPVEIMRQLTDIRERVAVGGTLPDRPVPADAPRVRDAARHGARHPIVFSDSSASRNTGSRLSSGRVGIDRGVGRCYR